MAATYQQQAPSSGSSHEVFLSFHGGDVRTNFADHLYHALVGAGIRTSRDDEELRKGETIGTDLIAAIRQSIISIPILSRNYGSSKWCLNELYEICECKRKRNQTVLPIFYRVEPREVRNQTGSYAKAFDEEHPKHFEQTTVQKWRDALKEIGKLSGWHIGDETLEGKLVREVVKIVSSTLNKRVMLVSNNLVGIHSHIEKMLELLDIECKVTKIVGIHGIGGIGKTTIARAVCNEVIGRFEEYAFVENVREDARQFGIHFLQNKLITAILKDGSPNIVDVDVGINVIRQRLCLMKVLVVLDDVDQDIQAESLIGDGKWFGIGSRIIITSRNKDILTAIKADEIYKPDLMGLDDSLELFSHYAFKKNLPPEDYMGISTTIVKTTGGLPLALRVIGSSLLKKKKPLWGSMLKGLQKVPNNDVMQSLKISYDDLEFTEQQMFLDIACFFVGMKKDIVCHTWEGCDFYPHVGLDVLCAKSLITINEDGDLRMHDMLRDLGRHIVRQESERPEQRSRIWSEEEVLDVLLKRKGTSDCLGLTVDFQKSNIHSWSKSRIGCLMSSGLDAMIELRFLQLDHAQILGNCINSFSELRQLSWKGCPEQYALTKFCPEKLVVLDLSNSEITENWMGWNNIKMAAKLKVLKLESCKQLCITPDLSRNQLLEVLSFKYCENLVGIDTSIGNLMSLATLDLRGCWSLVGLPTEIGLVTSLVTLDLRDCRSLVGLPAEIRLLKSMTTLDLSDCRSLVGLPTKIGLLTSLVSLDLRDCSSLVDLPAEIGFLTSLVTLDLRGCRSLVGLPTQIGFLTSLVTLHVADCHRLVEFPIENCHLTSLKTLILHWLLRLNHFDLGRMTSLTKLELVDCHSLKDISSLPPGLTSIKISHCKLLQSIPSLPSSLTIIEFSHCHSLPSIPSLPSCLTSMAVLHCNLVRSILLPLSLTSLWVDSCSQLVELASGSGSGLRNLKTLKVSLCGSLEEIEGVDEKLDSLVDCQILCCQSLKLLPKLRCSKYLRSLSLVGLDVMSHFEGEGMDSLEELYIDSCSSLKKIPYLRYSKGLRELYIRDCPELLEIPCLEGYESLQKLSIWGISLTTLSDDISTLKNLRELEIMKCEKLSGIPGLNGLDSLEVLTITECNSLSEIHGVDRLKSLRNLHISTCCSLERLPDLSNLENLKYLRVEGCKNLHKVSQVWEIEELKASGNWKLQIT